MEKIFAGVGVYVSDFPLAQIELKRDVTTGEDMEAHDLNPLHILSKVSCVQV